VWNEPPMERRVPKTYMALMMRFRTQYDISTAVTFLMAGVGIGSLLAILFAPRSERPTLVPARLRAFR
jgi:hypothetical protein